MLTILVRVVFWVTLLGALFMSSLVSKPPPWFVGIDDKLLHASSFAILAALSVLAYPSTPLLRMFVYLVGLGALIEAIQAIPSFARDPNWGDLVADGIGAGSVLIFAAILRWIWRRMFGSD